MLWVLTNCLPMCEQAAPSLKPEGARGRRAAPPPVPEPRLRRRMTRAQAPPARGRARTITWTRMRKWCGGPRWWLAAARISGAGSGRPDAQGGAGGGGSRWGWRPSHGFHLRSWPGAGPAAALCTPACARPPLWVPQAEAPTAAWGRWGGQREDRRVRSRREAAGGREPCPWRTPSLWWKGKCRPVLATLDKERWPCCLPAPSRPLCWRGWGDRLSLGWDVGTA